MNFWDFSDTLTRRLLAWSWFSIGSGLGLRSVDNDFSRALGAQFAAWGAIDALIALMGKSNTRAYRKLPEIEQLPKQKAEASKLYRILWVNTLLDIFYVLGGLWLWRRKASHSTTWKGHSLGIIIQGAFLFLFDLFHVFKVPKIK